MASASNMRLRRRTANFLLKGCGLSSLHDTRIKQFARAVLDEIDLQHIRDAYPCDSFNTRADLYGYVHDTCIKGEAIDYLEFGVFQGESIRHWVGLNKN